MSNKIFKKCLFVFISILTGYINSFSQVLSPIEQSYLTAYNFLDSSLKNNLLFKNAVFVTENCFKQNSLSSTLFDNIISESALICQGFYKKQHTEKYNARDGDNFLKNYAIYNFIGDTIHIQEDSISISSLPFQYDFDDAFGKEAWSNMFVTKLLATHQGNCHSLAYLYKILADEVGAKCWLSLAPNHIYIKNYSEKIGWYNTELTSGTFPTDAWVMVTGYVNPEAIKSGLYMDTLSNQQSIALCVLDLAKEYEFQTHNYYDGFILKCCDLVLQYHPVNPMTLLLKAETLKKIYLHEREMQFPKPTVTFNEMQNAYVTLAKLGYREMPEKMYQQWLKEMTTEKEKYTNKKVTTPSTKK